MSHPDEGLIHAWLDGELDAAEAARIEALVKADPAWAAAAAEARGFIAASSRIVGNLDDVAANVVPKAPGGAPDSTPHGRATVTRLRQSQNRGTPWWAMRVAALLVVATGTVLVVQRVSPDDTATPAERSNDRGVASLAAKNDARADAGGTAGIAASRAAEIDALRGLSVMGATANVPAAAPAPTADKTRRDVAAAGKSADEKRATPIISDSAATAAGTSLRKEASQLLPNSVVTTGVAEPRRMVADNCFREVVAAPGATVIVHRVRLTSDSTAVATSAAAPHGAAAPAGQVQMRQMVAAPAPTLRLRGDTLLVGVVNGVARVALRVTCPAP